MFTKFEDLPEELRKPDSGVKFEDGWIRLPNDGTRHFLMLPLAGSTSNLAVRARVLREAPADKGWTMVTIRESKNSRYSISPKIRDITYHTDRTDKGSYDVLATIPYTTPPRLGTEFIIEVAAVGDRLFARYDGSLVRIVRDSQQRTGWCSISGFEPIRDIEVINLDGIPEAEALRILGVDEKGNDLRALAAKQEQQQKAQAEQQSAIDAIPELNTLHEQFVKLQAERVSAPFEKDVAALNTSYLGGLDREIEKEKKAGHLDGVLVLEAEKKLINVGRVFNSSGAGENELKTRSTSMPIPAEDDDATPANLKALRKIYRDTFAKHEATRAANLKQLTDPLSIRLKQLESTLTQQNRIEHAKTVREYREKVSSARTEIAASTPSVAGRATEETRASSSGVVSQREVVDWIINTVKASVTGRTPKGNVTLKPGDEIPKGTFAVFKLMPATTDADTWGITDEELARIGELEELEEIQSSLCPNITGAGFAHLKKLKKLKKLILKCPNMVGANLAKLPNFPLLQEIVGIANYTPDEFRALPELKRWLSFNQANGALLTRDHMQALAERKSITSLSFGNAQISDDVIAPLAGMKQLERLELGNTQVTGECLGYLSDLPKLGFICIDAPTLEPRNIGKLANLKSLSKIGVRASVLVKDKEQWLALFAAMKNQLKDLDIPYATDLPADVLAQVKQALPKTNIKVW